LDSGRRIADHAAVVGRNRRTADELLREARSRIARLTPHEALAAVREGAIVVDIRSDLDRERAGVVPGSVHVPRTVLEWRLDPASAWRNPHVAGSGRRLLVLCDHGFSSSLAAAALVELGYEDAADVEGGFEAWLGAGLPVARPARRREPGELPGMATPESAEAGPP
jgi:rhodanese-related sulfurtransferase